MNNFWDEIFYSLKYGVTPLFKRIVTPHNARETIYNGWEMIHYVSSVQHNESRKLTFLIWLVEACGVSIHTRTSDGQTPLHIATFHQFFELGNLLLKLGACATKDNYGLTPLDYLVKGDWALSNCQTILCVDKNIIEFAWNLIDHGAQYNHNETRNPCKLVKRMFKARTNAKRAVLALIGSRTRRCSVFLNANDINIVKCVAKLVWKSRRLQDKYGFVWE